MARNAGTVIENTWTKGLITEATGINFPEHAATDADNVRFNQKGNVTRRKGIDLETDYEILPYTAAQGVVKEFLWHAVAKTGSYTFVVLQQGAFVHFFQLEAGSALSAGIQPTSLDLSDYKSASAPELKDTPVSFSSGSGYLFIAHPYCDPIIIRYDIDDASFEAARITIRIRDFEGVEDNLGVLDNPGSLSSLHHYNLKNQGWDQQVRVGNVTNELGDGGSNSPSPETSLTWETLP